MNGCFSSIIRSRQGAKQEKKTLSRLAALREHLPGVSYLALILSSRLNR